MPLTLTQTVEIDTTLLAQNLIQNVERVLAELYHEPSSLECALDAIEEAKQAIAKLEDAAEIAEARQRLQQAICK